MSANNDALNKRSELKAASRADDEKQMNSGVVSKAEMQALNGGGMRQLMRGAKIRRGPAEQE